MKKSFQSLSLVRLFISILTLLLLLCSVRIANAQSKEGSAGRLGVDVLRMHDQKGRPFWAANIPKIEVDYPIASKYLQLELGWKIQWGFSKFYVDHLPDFLPSLGARIYPFGKFLSVYGNGSWGTFIFNNSTLTAEAGADLDIRTGREDGDNSYLAIGAGYGYKHVGHLGDFAPHDQWWITSDYVVFRIGFRFRTLPD